ncbi:unnamed protein product [Mytilus edulis]|uniref:Uncharacterized protein n=1 Tax=Mytilus edulis TaxID=6550 RepID=A0A8S3PMH5_MYTED|nr:unnamed protein product [Mytilus edulis]
MARKIKQENLKEYLDSIETFNLANIIRKGREVKTKYVKAEKGENGFLTDTIIFKSEDIDKPKQRIWVARETLLCNGTGNCLRNCGGFGECVEGCSKKDEKRAKSGHRCSFRVQLHLYSDDMEQWEVTFEGHHVPPTTVWVAPNKNPLKQNEIRKRALTLMKDGITSSKKMKLNLKEDVSQKQLQSFIQYRKKKEKKDGTVMRLSNYSDSSDESLQRKTTF